MAAEHTFKLLLAETKKTNATGNKRPRTDEAHPGTGSDGTTEKRPRPKRGSKPKGAAKDA